MTDAPPVPPRTWLYACVPAADRGGVQAVFRQVGRALTGAGHTVAVLWAHPSAHGMPGESCLTLPTDPRRPLDAVGSLYRLVRALHRDRPSIVNVHFPMGQLAWFLLLRPVFRYRIVVTLHGSDLLAPAGPARHALGHFLRRADAVIAVSDALRRAAVERHRLDPRRVRLVANGIDAGFWTPAPEAGPEGRTAAVAADAPGTEPGSTSGAAPGVRLVAVGRLVRVKGFDLLLDAFARLHRERPGLHATLEIVGDGPGRESLERRASAHGLADRVRFAGHLDAPALRSVLRGATLFVLPSRSEGMPLALLEAMACGTPVLATDVGGVGEVLTGLPACIVGPDDAEALADGLRVLLDDAARLVRLGRTARRVARSHDAASVGRAYAALFAELVAGPPPSRGRPGVRARPGSAA